MITPQMSGWCRFPETADPEGSHARCAGGNTARPTREFQPCSCTCHLGEEYDCGNCGNTLREAPYWPNEDEPDEMVYVHVIDGAVTGEECPR